jgi:multisubunit Na+/H+ antiporter MnhG subunit
MGIDIRLPIGLMFTLFGLLLTTFGLFSDRSIYTRSLGINVNVGWGVVLLVFGLVMFFLARSASAATKRAESKEPAGPGTSAARSDA